MQSAGDGGYHSQAGRGPLPAPRAGSHALRPAPPPTGRAGSSLGPRPAPRPELWGRRGGGTGGSGERGAGSEASKEETDRPGKTDKDQATESSGAYFWGAGVGGHHTRTPHT